MGLRQDERDGEVEGRRDQTLEGQIYSLCGKQGHGGRFVVQGWEAKLEESVCMYISSSP